VSDLSLAGPSRVVILDGARTPIGSFGGALRDVPPTDLALVAADEALRRTGVDLQAVDNVVFGLVVQSAPDAPYLARHVALRAGLPESVPASAVNRMCGSGLQAVLDAALSIGAGYARLALAGGVENMSLAPHAVYGARWGLGSGPASMEDTLWAALTDRFCDLGMAETAENLAEQYAISRQAQDAFALLSHQRATSACAAGRLAEEIAPVPLVDRAGKAVEVAQDEHIGADTSLERLAALPARFREQGTVTAGNASGINDGAAALILADEAYAREAGLTPLSRLLSWAVVGVDPRYMGIGPVPAARQALRRAGLELKDMDRIEINEAFAAQYLAVEQELGLDRERVNVNGGAIALGHPLGATGARLLLTLLYELRRTGLRYGLAAMCIGGGQGIAAVVENMRR
jgi:acetyl-CoA acetyltransferase family protein